MYLSHSNTRHAARTTAREAAFLWLIASVSACSTWCTVYSCEASECNDCYVCQNVEGTRACSSHCSLLLCGEDELCYGCPECRQPSGEQCASFCNERTCGDALCTGCNFCHELKAGLLCSPWCNGAETCAIKACTGCEGCEAYSASVLQQLLNETEAEWATVAQQMVSSIEKIAFKDGFLDVPNEEIRANLFGRCNHINNYTIATRNKHWQCGEGDSETTQNFFLDSNSRLDGISYAPQLAVREMLASFTGVEREQIDRLLIKSGLNGTEDPLTMQRSQGSWCGMPIPPNGDSGADVTSYWSTCVVPNAGYFNVLQCDKGGNDTYAVLGFAALNQGVCYPAHHHFASEMYWQVGGTATWRTWGCQEGELNCSPNVSSSLGPPYGMNNNPNAWRDANGSMVPGLGTHSQPPQLPHEIDTTQTSNGLSVDGALMVYFWGLMESTVNAYESSLRFDGYDPYKTGSCAFNLSSESTVSQSLNSDGSIELVYNETICPRSLYPWRFNVTSPSNPPSVPSVDSPPVLSDPPSAPSPNPPSAPSAPPVPVPNTPTLSEELSGWEIVGIVFTSIFSTLFAIVLLILARRFGGRFSLRRPSAAPSSTELPTAAANEVQLAA